MFDVPQITHYNIPFSISHAIEKKSHLKEEDVLNIEDLIKKNIKSFITFDNKAYSPFSNRIKEIKELKNNWDNYEGYSPSPEIIKKVERFLEVLPKKYSNLLQEENIFPNPHGTITLEWRKTKEYVISIEFGLSNSSFYSILNNNKDFDENLESILSSKKLINAFNKIIA